MITFGLFESWKEIGTRSVSSARRPAEFIGQQIRSILFGSTSPAGGQMELADISDERQFWLREDRPVHGMVRLKRFKVIDWFPRVPGVYWSTSAQIARRAVYSVATENDASLGRYFTPEGKGGLIEGGGVGTVRLRPRKIDGTVCWFATALQGAECHAGIPLAIPDSLIRKSSGRWGERFEIEGQIRFLQDVGLDEPAAAARHASPLIVFVERFQASPRTEPEPVLIAPVVLFERNTAGGDDRPRPGFTFVTCQAGADSKLDEAVEWIEKYVRKFDGRVITNFDEQRPTLAYAPLSYQRLVERSYERRIVGRLCGAVQAENIEHLIINHHGDTVMGNQVNVTGHAIVNIDSVLKGVTQKIGETEGLDSAQKAQLEPLVQLLRAELERIKASHKDEVAEIALALQKAVALADRPREERKPNLLKLSAEGLKSAAALVGDVAPAVISTAASIAKFITGLQ